MEVRGTEAKTTENQVLRTKIAAQEVRGQDLSNDD